MTSSESIFPVAALQVLAGDPGIAAAIVYGSAAKGRLRPDSDIDIAVLFAPLAEPRVGAGHGFLELLGRLTVAAGRDAHLVDLRGCDNALRRSIFASGIRLFDRSGQVLRDLERSTLVEYADWDYARRIIDRGQRRRLEQVLG